MQVTDEMARAAWNRWLELEAEGGLDRDTVMRHAVQAALDAMPKATGGYVDGDSVRVRLSDASCTYTLPPEMTRGALPPNATVSINLSAPDDKTIIETLARVLGSLTQREAVSALDILGGQPLATIPDEMLSTDGFEDAMATAMQHRIPVTEPRPLASEGELHLHLGLSREVVGRMIVQRNQYDPPFPQPVGQYTKDRKRSFPEPLYDPEAVKAWYNALPQAADE